MEPHEHTWSKWERIDYTDRGLPLVERRYCTSGCDSTDERTAEPRDGEVRVYVAFPDWAMAAASSVRRPRS